MTALPPGHTPRTPSAADAAQTAAEAIRHLDHLTAPQAGYPGLDVPGDLYDTLGALTATAQRLNQTLDQLSRWVIEQGQAGRITTPGRTGATSDAVAALTDALDRAAQHVAATAGDVNAAWSASAVLAPAEPQRSPTGWQQGNSPDRHPGPDLGAGL